MRQRDDTYELLPRDKLPQISLTRSVLNVCLQRFARPPRVAASSIPQPIQAARSITFRTDGSAEGLMSTRVFITLYCLGHLVGALTCLVPKAAGVACAAMGLVLSFPGSLFSLGMLQFDVAGHVLGTYDFWFFTTVSTISNVLLANALGDGRACIAIMLWLGNLQMSFVDANTRLICHLVLASIAAVGLHVVVLVTTDLGSVDQLRPKTLFTLHNRTVDDANLISNGLVTMLVLHCRNVYRRHVELVQQRRIGCKILRCINLRCRLVLKLSSAIPPTGKINSFYYVDPSVDLAKLAYPQSPMLYVQVPRAFDPTQTFYPVHLDPLHWKPRERAAFAGLGLSALALTTSVFAIFPSPYTRPVALGGLLLTMVFMGMTFALYQRQLFRHLITSFDFIFQSFQLTMGISCGATLFAWDARSIAMAAIWIWLHWVITIDALTPLMKEKIGFHPRVLVPLLLLFVAAQVAAMLELLVFDRWGLRDHAYVAIAGSMELRIMPFFFSRLHASALWSFRVLWRLRNADAKDALIILGRMGYSYLRPEVATCELPPSPSSLVAEARPNQIVPTD